MYDQVSATVQSPSQSRSGTSDSMKLDHSTSYYSHPDIPARIRSLLLSSQIRNPPRTPWPSEETIFHYHENPCIVYGPDSMKASNVAEVAPLRLGIFGFPLNLPLASLNNSVIVSMVDEENRSDLPTSTPRKPRANIKSYDGSNPDMDPTRDDSTTHRMLSQDCSSSPSSKRNKDLTSIAHLATGAGIHTPPDDHGTRVPFTAAEFSMIFRDAACDNLQLGFEEEYVLSLSDPSNRPSQSHPTPRLKDPTTSIASAKSSIHHNALPKSSITAWKPADVGLPAQPILITTTETSSIPAGSGIISNPRTDHSHTHQLVTPVEALTSILELPQSLNHVVGSNSKTQIHSILDDWIDLDYHQNISLVGREITQVPVKTAVDQAASLTVIDDSGSEALPKPALETLAEAALRAEKYLRRNVPAADEASSDTEAGQRSIIESTGKRSTISSQDKVFKLPSTAAREDSASFENLAPQESSNTRMSATQTKGVNEKSQKQNWNLRSWKQHPKEYPFKHSPIPQRKHSLDSSIQILPLNLESLLPRNHFLEDVSSKSGKEVQALLPVTASKTTNSTARGNSPSTSHARQPKLKDMYTNFLRARQQIQPYIGNKPYNPCLTAIPPRKHRLPNQSSKLVRSSESQSDAEIKSAEPEMLEAFAKTMADLENLMREALHVAQQSAVGGDPDRVSGLLSKASASRNCTEQRQYRRKQIRSALRAQVSGTFSYKDSVHESYSSDSSDSAPHYSDASNHAYEEYNSSVPSETTKIPTVDLHLKSQGQPSYSPIRPSIIQLVHELGSSKSMVGKLLPKNTQAKTSSTESDSRNFSMTPLVVGVPTIRDGNTESSVQTRSWHTSMPPSEKRTSSERATPIKRQRNTPVKKNLPQAKEPYQEDDLTRTQAKRSSKAILDKTEVIEFIKVFHHPPIQSRHSSLALRKTRADNASQPIDFTSAVELGSNVKHADVCSQQSLRISSLGNLNASQENLSEVDFSSPPSLGRQRVLAREPTAENFIAPTDANEAITGTPKLHISGRRLQNKASPPKHNSLSHLNLRGKSHISLRDDKGFSLSKSHRRQPIARDWSPARKRFTASIACISTALIGLLVGIYAGEVPSIQYYIADFYHYSILGNVFFFVTLAITTFFFWPLPLLHGRKPYILIALTLAMPLLFPQAIAVSMQRSPYVSTYRVMLILPRTAMGIALGFANINFMATLTDLFGASLQSKNPHQETVNDLDVRRHGGGLGLWLGIWTWCYSGSIGVGFLIGATIINTLSPDWGFYVSIIIIAAVLLLNVVTPEVRRSAYRRSVTEVHTLKDISRRLARGEVMMHRLQTGPKWWGEEFHQGVMLSLDMLRQPGFLIMSFYVAWMYGQIVLVIVLLGSLMSKYYRFTSPAVGAATMAIPIGALLAIPFQKASLFSRERRQPQRTDSMTFNTKVTFSSHLIRRAIFTLVLPFAGLAYTLSSAGPPTPFILPILFAGLIGFLSNLAIAECNGIIMETFDTSDLQPGMTGRPRGTSGERTKRKRTNYSSFPRVSSAFAIIHALGFLIGAAATGVGGVAERQIGAQAATGVMAGILLFLTIGTLGVLYRFKEIQIIPSHSEEDMERWERARGLSIQRNEETLPQGAMNNPAPEQEEPWRPTIIGNPSGKTRRMSILELGHLSRWSEIRRKNRLVDEISREAQHPNLAVLKDIRRDISAGAHRAGSRRSQRSTRSHLTQGSEEPGSYEEVDLGERNKST